jgi:hypothetical protein
MSDFMKRTLLFCAFLLSFGLSSCNCADPPPVGPVEDEEQARVQVPTPSVQGVTLRQS